MIALAWTKDDLPQALREAAGDLWKVAKALYNGYLLAEVEGDAVALTIADMQRRGMLR